MAKKNNSLSLIIKKAKEIRKKDEKWTGAVKRATSILKREKKIG